MFTDVVTVPRRFLELFLPLSDAVAGFLILQSFEDRLVFERDTQELLLTLVSVQTWFRIEVCLVGGPVILHDVRHLFQQNAVLSFDLCVSPFKESVL